MADQYTIYFTKEERIRYDKLCKENGYKTLSKLIRQVLDNAIVNPDVLRPSEGFDVSSFLESLKELELGGLTEELVEYMEKLIIKRLDVVERQNDWIIRKLRGSGEDIEKLKKNSELSDVVFDE